MTLQPVLHNNIVTLGAIYLLFAIATCASTYVFLYAPLQKKHLLEISLKKMNAEALLAQTLRPRLKQLKSALKKTATSYSNVLTFITAATKTHHLQIKDISSSPQAGIQLSLTGSYNNCLALIHFFVQQRLPKKITHLSIQKEKTLTMHIQFN